MTKATRFGKEVKWDGKVICQASSDKTAESLLRVLNKDPELTRRCFTTEMLLDTVYGRAGEVVEVPRSHITRSPGPVNCLKRCNVQGECISSPDERCTRCGAKKPYETCFFFDSQGNSKVD